MAMKGNKYGIHRVISPEGVLTQAAYKIDNDMDKLYSQTRLSATLYPLTSTRLPLARLRKRAIRIQKRSRK